MSSVTTEELRSFHKIDRELYSRLVVTLRREAVQSMQIMALWLWIEQVGYPNVVYIMLPLSDVVVNALAEEAISCLNCLESDSPPLSTIDDDLPMTKRLMKKEISLQFFYQNRFQAINGITKTVNDVCFRAFEDIAKLMIPDTTDQDVVVPHGNVGGGTDQLQENVGELVPPIRPRLMFPVPLVRPSGLVHPHFQPPLIGVPPPSLLGTRPVLPNFDQIFHLGQLSLGDESTEALGASILNPRAKPWSPSEEVPEVERNDDEVPQDERTMFVTFSRGYPMTEKEVQEFFTRKYGECIETIIMQEVPPNTQSLYARLVFYSVAAIAEILDGREKVKFVINGKHVWARLYVAKQGRVTPPPPPPPPPPSAT